MVILSIRGFGAYNGNFSYAWVRMVRMFMGAGVNLTLQVPMAGPDLVVFSEDSALDTVVRLKGSATGGNLRKMNFLHHVLLREAAVHAVSWSWPTVMAPAVAPAVAPAGTPAPAPTMTLRPVRRGPVATSSVVVGGLFR